MDIMASDSSRVSGSRSSTDDEDDNDNEESENHYPLDAGSNSPKHHTDEKKHTRKQKLPKKKKHGNTDAPAKSVFEGGLIRYPGLRRPTPTKTRPLWFNFLGLHEFFSPIFWRAILVELVGMTIQVAVSIFIVVGVLSSGFPFPSLVIGISHMPLITSFIFALAAASGAHLNPLITISTVCGGLTSPLRGLLYVGAQIGGSIAGSAIMYGVLPIEKSMIYHLGGCSIGALPPGSAFLAEIVLSFFLLFIAFGLALDPRQGPMFGLILPPIYIGITLGLCIFVGGLVAPEANYTGPSLNPARCLGPAIVLGENTSHHWVYWIGTIVTSILHGILYVVAPPLHKEMFGKPTKLDKES